jgi:hypothetical protein
MNYSVSFNEKTGKYAVYQGARRIRVFNTEKEAWAFIVRGRSA